MRLQSIYFLEGKETITVSNDLMVQSAFFAIFTFSYVLISDSQYYRGMPNSTSTDSTDADRCARQDQIRRRDLNMFYGLHPRVLHIGGAGAVGNPPRLSLPPRANVTAVSAPFRVLRPLLPQYLQGAVMDASRQCNLGGKHVCGDGSDCRRNSTKSSPGAAGTNWTYEYKSRTEEEGEENQQPSLQSPLSPEMSLNPVGEEQDDDIVDGPVDSVEQESFLSDRWK